MNHIRGYQFFPQLFSNPSTPLLFSHLILPAPGALAPPLSLVFCLAFAPLSPSVLFLVITHHYQGNLFSAQQTSSRTHPSTPILPFSIPIHSIQLHTHTSASYNLMKSSFDRLINNSRRLEHTSSCSQGRFLDSRINFFIFYFSAVSF